MDQFHDMLDGSHLRTVHLWNHPWRVGACEYWFHVCTSFREIFETCHLVAVGKMVPRKTKEAMKLYETYILILITNALATFFWRICRCRCGVVGTLLDFCAREASNLDLQRHASPGWFVGMFLGFPGSNGTLLEDARMRTYYYNHNVYNHTIYLQYVWLAVAAGYVSFPGFPRPGISLSYLPFSTYLRCRILCELIIPLGMHLGTHRHGVGRDRNGAEILNPCFCRGRCHVWLIF